MLSIALTKLMPKKVRSAFLISLIEQTPNLPHIATYLEELRDKQVLNAVTTKDELFDLVKDMPDARQILQALLSLTPKDVGLKVKSKPDLSLQNRDLLIAMYQPYIGPDGKERNPLTKYLPKTVHNAFRTMNVAYLDYLADNYDPALSKRPGLIVTSGYRSPWYQAAIYIINVAESGVLGMADQVTLPGYSGHSNLTDCAIDMTHLGNAYGTREKTDGRLFGFEKTTEFEWLMKNASEFGFWLPYYPNNPDGIAYEPWHWQFTGSVKKANNLMKKHKVAQKVASV